jgi:hypothetical protein
MTDDANMVEDNPAWKAVRFEWEKRNCGNGQTVCDLIGNQGRIDDWYEPQKSMTLYTVEY